jgi:hypothetical protein
MDNKLTQDNKHFGLLLKTKVRLSFYFTVLLLTSVIASGWSVWSTNAVNQKTIDIIKSDLGRMVKLIDFGLQEKFNETEGLMAKTAEEISKLDNLDACRQHLKEASTHAPSYYHFTLVDKEGNILCSSLDLTEQQKKLNASSRRYFQEAKETKKFSVGTYQVGYVTQKPSVGFGYPLIDSQGNVDKVLVASMGFEWIDRMFEKVNMPKEFTIVITDQDGIVISSYPERNRGKFGLDIRLTAALASSDSGSIILEDDQKRKWVFSYSKSGNSKDPDITISAGVPTDLVTEKYKPLILLRWGVTGVMFIALGILGLIEARRTNR